MADEAAFLHELLEAIKISNVELPVLTHVEGAVAAFRRMFRGAKVKGGGIEIDIGEAAIRDLAICSTHRNSTAFARDSIIFAV